MPAVRLTLGRLADEMTVSTAEVLSLLLQKGAAIEEVRRRELSLEEIYAEIVGKEAG